MRLLNHLFKTLLFLVAVFFIGGYFISDQWAVSRSITIQARPERIYPYISQFKAWEQWSPWNTSKDPSLKYTYEGSDSSVIGAKQSWTSEKMGTGWMQFTDANPQTGVAYTLFIDMGHAQSTLKGHIAFTSEDDATLVTWTDQGHSEQHYMKRWMSLIMKPMLARDIEKGLQGLKDIVENNS